MQELGITYTPAERRGMLQRPANHGPYVENRAKRNVRLKAERSVHRAKELEQYMEARRAKIAVVDIQETFEGGAGI